MDAAFENYSFFTNKQVYRKYNFYLKNHINNKLILLIIKNCNDYKSRYS